MGRAVEDELITWAEQELPRLVDTVVEDVRSQVQLYRDEHAVPHHELRSSIEQNLRFLLAVMRDPEHRPDLAVPSSTGRRRAVQGAPLPEVLQVYRISFTVLWGSLSDRALGMSAAAAADLLAVSTLVWEVSGAHAAALTEAYRATTAELVIAQQRRRAALVDVLFTGHVGGEGGPWEAAELLGFPNDHRLAVVVCRSRSIAEESLPGVEQALAKQGIASAWRLSASSQLGVVSVHPDREQVVIEVLRQSATGQTGVSPFYDSPADTPRALRLARAAIPAERGAGARVTVFSENPLAALVATDPSEGARLTESVLGPVLALPESDRDALIETLIAYLDYAGSPKAAATALHFHPNTIRYRLRRIEELTGRSFGDPNDVAAFAVAALVAGIRDRDR